MLKKTGIFEFLDRGRRLSQQLAWFDTFRFDTRFKDDILDKVRQQLDSGENSEGEIVGYYSPFTESLSRGKKKAYTPYNFQDTMKFFNSLYISYTPDTIKVDGNGQKEDENIIIKYSQDGDLLGISPENWDWFIEQMKTKYINYARKVLFRSR